MTRPTSQVPGPRSQVPGPKSQVPDPSSPAAIGFPCLPQAGHELAAQLRGRRPTFVLVVAHTDTCLIPGISAAGATPELRCLTPAADAEALHYGGARCLNGVPCNPLGPPGPALISVAALQLAPMDVYVVDAGTLVRPQAPAIVLGTQPGRSIVSGQAVPHAAVLLERGRALGRRLAEQAEYLVLAESVPGGTTTAMAVLMALGYAAEGRISGSLDGNAHQLKSEVVQAALRASGIAGPWTVDGGPWQEVPEDAVDRLRSTVHGLPSTVEILSRVGDPMQPAAVGLALGALERCPVLLAGGTQMIAVLAAMQAYAAEQRASLPDGPLGLATTRWVVEDPASDFAGLLAEVAPVPALCSALCFAASRHPALQLYESFLVKEGVGAGGAAVAAALAADVGAAQLLERVECLYDRLADPRPTEPRP